MAWIKCDFMVPDVDFIKFKIIHQKLFVFFAILIKLFFKGPTLFIKAIIN